VQRFFRILFWIAAPVVVAGSAVAWHYVYRPLPQLDGSAPLPGLAQSVTVDRDGWGIPHIRAGSLNDLVEAQGYVMAQDRLWQMDLMRRVARGELSEIFGPLALDMDRQYRTLGLARAAERDAGQLDPESRDALEAYARGVNHFIEQHRGRLPLEFSLLGYQPRPWQPADTLVIVGYMYQDLTHTWEAELNRAKVTERVGAERARELFSQESELDRYVVGEAGQSDHGQAGSDEQDDEDEIQPDNVLKTAAPSAPLRFTPDTPDVAATLWPSVRSRLAGAAEDIHRGLGSNNWVVSGDYTASGKPLLANDTHLQLTVPPIWYEIHLTAPGWNVKGFTLPGAPLVIIGHNARIAWGFTNNGADVQDLYIETFNSANPGEYRVHGKWQAAQLVQETIRVKGQADQKLTVVVTRHGPVVRREGEKAYALRWTALEPGGLAYSYQWLGRARNWEEFRNELKRVWGPGQNAVYADVDGNIGYIMAARVPVRKKGHGEVPVPGDSDDYEWTGYIPFEQLPQVFNPDDGLIATANARVVGPKYKPYLTDRWELPYRTARIYGLLADKSGLRAEDMLKVQTDVYSYAHLFLARQLVAAGQVAEPNDARARELLERLKDWSGEAGADEPEVSFLEAVRVETLYLLLQPYLGEETKLYQWRSSVFVQKVLTERPKRWLPKQYASYDELLAAAADRAVARLERESGSRRISGWAWKRFNSLQMLHLLGRRGFLRWLLSITDQPQNGTRYSIRAASPTDGPSMRFTADLGNWDESLMQIPAGESGQVGSAHYKDQFSYWFEGKPITAPFSEAAEADVRQHTLTLKPAP
jgi:penicillin amidase